MTPTRWLVAHQATAMPVKPKFPMKLSLIWCSSPCSTLRAKKPRQHAGDDHGQDHHLGIGDAPHRRRHSGWHPRADLSPSWVCQMKTHTRAAQKRAQEEADVEGLWACVAIPKPAASSLIFGSQLATANTLLSVAHGSWRLEDVDQEVSRPSGGGDEVEHDGGDDDVAAALGLQPGRDEAPRPHQQAAP